MENFVMNQVGFQLRYLACVLAACALPLVGCEHAKSEPATTEQAVSRISIDVAVARVEKRTIHKATTAFGRCEALPEYQALVTPVIEGRVAELLAKQGDEVKAGQPLVQLDTTLAQADLKEKEAARDSLVASLQALNSVPRTEEQRTNQLAVEQADLALKRAQVLLDRLRPLRERNEVPEAQIIDAEQARTQAELQKKTAQAQLDQLMLSPRPELLAEAKSKVTVAEEAVKTARSRLDLHTIRAPVAGILDSLSCRKGQTVPTGTTVGEIINTRKVLAVAWLPPTWLQGIKVGQAAQVRVESNQSASPNNTTPATQGKIVYIAHSTDPQTGNISIHVRVPNPDAKLVVGQTISIEFEGEKSKENLCVPLAAIHDEGDAAAVTVVRDGKAAVLKPTIGASDSSWVAISGTDLAEGESVVVAGAYNLPDGTAVRIVPSAEPSPGTPVTDKGQNSSSRRK
jgi:multidrug efflux pump subunit AcrA (membrane-fusion protein)